MSKKNLEDSWGDPSQHYKKKALLEETLPSGTTLKSPTVELSASRAELQVAAFRMGTSFGGVLSGDVAAFELSLILNSNPSC